MNNRLIIIGASGHGKVVADIAISMNKWKDIAFLDDNELIKKVLGLQVIGKSTDAVKYIGNSDIFVAVGNNRIREKIQEEIELLGANVPVLLHKNALIGTDVEIGRGTVIMAGVVINCCTLIGKGCIINTGSTIDHDNVVEDYVHISPGANLAGSVKVGKGSWIGIGSAVINNINITSGCIVGAGAVVVKDIIEPGTYIGVPAKKVN
jgi:sugar O-acyltransferase (sialic acid O-acetyltransferase NeuD family)